MAKHVEMFEICCNGCHKTIGAFVKKEIPKTFICKSCGLGQQSEYPKIMGRSHNGRIYPTEYFENQ